MKKLLLLRHAKSSWDDPALDDHERPLTSRGRKSAALIARYIKDGGLEPAIVLCTSAARAQQTLDEIRPSLPDAVIKVEPRLYGADGSQLAARIRRLSQSSPSVLIIGHNPAMQELVLTLAPKGQRSDAVRKKFPTAALAVLEVPIDEWKALQPGEASFVDLVTPKLLR